jgi:dihydropteroate synthase
VLRAQGAAVIDLGAQSTQNYADDIASGEQIESMLPVITALSAEGAVVSVETYEPEIAQVGLGAGARVLNLTGVAHDDEMFALAARGNGVLLKDKIGRIATVSVLYTDNV